MKVNGITDWGTVFWKMHSRMILDCHFLYVFILVIPRLAARSHCSNTPSPVNCFDTEFIPVSVVLFGDKMLFQTRILTCSIKHLPAIWVEACFDYWLFIPTI